MHLPKIKSTMAFDSSFFFFLSCKKMDLCNHASTDMIDQIRIVISSMLQLLAAIVDRV